MKTTSYIYIERFKFATEKIFELAAKRQEILYKNDCANVQEIEKEIAFWKSKQEKFLKIFNAINSENGDFGASPLFARLLWLEIIDLQIEEIAPSSVELALKNLMAHLEKKAVSVEIAEKLARNELPIDEHNALIAKFAIKPFKNSTEHDEDDKKFGRCWKVF